MNSKAEEYIRQQLAATGFVVIDAAIAYKLRGGGDIWASPTNCGSDFNEALPKLRAFLLSLGVELYEADFTGAGQWVLVAARSTDSLARRVAWITGAKPEHLRRAEPEPEKPAAPMLLNSEEIPTWRCHKRTEMLAAKGFREDAAGNLHPIEPYAAVE